MPRSCPGLFFSFAFESVVTEELDLVNENVANFKYFSVLLVYCIDQDF